MRGVPTIDLADLDGDTRSVVVETIAGSAEEWGFFQVVNHGIPDDLVERTWQQTEAFFAQSRDRKLLLSRTKENPRGYYDRELTKNARDLKEVFDYGKPPRPDLPDDHPTNRAAVDGVNQWPDDLAEFRPTMMAYLQGCETLGVRLLEALVEGLGVPRSTLTGHFVPAHTGFIRLNYYPLEDPLEPEARESVTELGDMALHHHTDAGALTILLQDDVGGLQVESGGEWFDVAPTPGGLVINVGDMMQIWSNDRYQAAMHRVRPTSRRARYSIPFFFNPSYETDCAPLADGSEPRYRTVNWGAFRQARTDGDYADFGKEIQIADFRV